MSKIPETRVERWRRLYHLKGRGWAREQALVVVGAGLLLLLFVGLNRLFHDMSDQIGKSHWWTKLSPNVRYLIEGILLEVVGLVFFRGRLRKRGGFRVASFWDVRVFVGEIAMIVGGVVFLMKAGGLI